MAFGKLSIGQLFITVILIPAICCTEIPDVCTNDNQCLENECCRPKSFFKVFKRCVAFSGKVGERCGGRYYCSTCANGLECVPTAPSSILQFFSGTGTCERPHRHGADPAEFVIQ